MRAIVHGLQFGAHGLPLMGSGDWNDGMNRVGIDGTGESVWLGFFLYAVLRQFAEVAQRTGDAPFAERCDAEAAKLRQNLEQHALGRRMVSARVFRRRHAARLGGQRRVPDRFGRAELVGALGRRAIAERSRMAMQAVDARLVRRDHALIQLLDPPFDQIGASTPATSAATSRACGRTAASTRTARSGRRWRSPRWAMRERAWELTTMINPVNHARTPEAIATYKVEPYVIAADVYALAPHTGRGGWTLVHGLGGLDVSAHRRVAARRDARERSSARRRRAFPRIGPASRCAIGTAERRTTSWSGRRRPAPTQASGGPPSRSMASCNPTARFRSSTMARSHQVRVDVHARRSDSGVRPTACAYVGQRTDRTGTIA